MKNRFPLSFPPGPVEDRQRRRQEKIEEEVLGEHRHGNTDSDESHVSGLFSGFDEEIGTEDEKKRGEVFEQADAVIHCPIVVESEEERDSQGRALGEIASDGEIEEEDTEKAEGDIRHFDRDDADAENPEPPVIDSRQDGIIEKRIPLVGRPGAEENFIPSVVAVHGLIEEDSGAPRQGDEKRRRISFEVLKPKRGCQNENDEKGNNEEGRAAFLIQVPTIVLIIEDIFSSSQ